MIETSDPQPRKEAEFPKKEVIQKFKDKYKIKEEEKARLNWHDKVHCDDAEVAHLLLCCLVWI